jgi:membrane protease YdiL (CAAX protease family)
MNMVVSTFAKPFQLIRGGSFPRRLADGVSQAPWSWRSAAVAVAVSFAAISGMPRLLYAACGLRGRDYLFPELVWSIPMFLCLKFLAQQSGTTIEKAFGLTGVRFSQVLRSGILLFILESLLGFLTVTILISLRIKPGPHREVPSSLFFVLDATVWGPICEELLFRALLYTSLRTRLGVAPSILITAVGFAMFHVPTSYDHMTFLFVSAILSSFWYERTRCLWPNIISHSLHNTLLTVLQ